MTLTSKPASRHLLPLTAICSSKAAHSTCTPSGVSAEAAPLSVLWSCWSRALLPGNHCLFLQAFGPLQPILIQSFLHFCLLEIQLPGILLKFFLGGSCATLWLFFTLLSALHILVCCVCFYLCLECSWEASFLFQIPYLLSSQSKWFPSNNSSLAFMQ